MRFKTLICAAAVCAVSLAGCAAQTPQGDPEYLTRSRRSAMDDVEWTPVREFRFASRAETDSAHVADGAWEVYGGRLRAVLGDRNRTILLSWSGMDPVRVEFEARLRPDAEGRIGDITVLLNTLAVPGYWGEGYALTTGSYYNNCTTFYRLGKRLARTEWSPVQPNAWNQVAVEFAGGHIRYWLNGQILLEAWDPEPLEMDASRWIGLRTWATTMEVDNLSIYKGATR